MNSNFFNNIRSLINPNTDPNTNQNTNQNTDQNTNTLLRNEEALNYLNNVLFVTNYNDSDYEFRPNLPYRIMYAYRTLRDTSFIENFINNTFIANNVTNSKKVIADTELIKLKHITFKKEDEINSNIECPIMYYEFSENEEIIKLPCQHNYNKDAILKWLNEESHTCPICRYEFEYKEINNVKDGDEVRDEDEDEDELRDLGELRDLDEDEDPNNTENNVLNNYISVDEFMMQEILLNSYNNNNNNNYNNNNTN